MPKTLLKRKSSAKINLTLDILERDEKTGYHRIQTILHEVPELFDELTFEPRDDSIIEVMCDHPDVPEDNTILKAAQLLQARHAPHSGITITLTKNIPAQSGLGGAASNAATTLVALNELWELKLPGEKLMTYGAEIGKDVPFFIVGGTALGMHFGEHLMPLLPPESTQIEIIETDISIPTKEAYKSLNLSRCGKRNHDTSLVVEALNGRKNHDLKSLLHNDFEIQFFENHPELKEKYPEAHLCGSGGALFQLKTSQQSGMKEPKP